MTQQTIRRLMRDHLTGHLVEVFERRSGKRRDDRRYVQLLDSLDEVNQGGDTDDEDDDED